jgi:hypothetical protein
MENIPLSWLPLVGLLAVPFVVVFVIRFGPIAALAVVNTVLIVAAVRIMFGSSDLSSVPFDWT